ncbi:MAG: CHAT domain-containing protein [Microcoleus sp. SM1_3_4]|nr:CHAT domain-containing protein [Microcoleus sp. SM1_3_4]
MFDRFERLKEILQVGAIEEKLAGDGITNLILIPHRDLHRFPIHVLFSGEFAISYLPSFRVGINLKQRFTPPSINSILSIENPDSVIIDEKGQQKRFPPLPAAEIESEIICRMFANSTRRADTTATLDEVTTLLQQQHNFFHFTGHGSYNFENPLESALYLNHTDKLTVKEIIDLNLSNYKLIYLSACETAVTEKQTILAEYVGLTSGFMRAGVGCAVSTLWPVESGASTLLTIDFYRRWLEGGDTIPAALANSQKWLRNATREDLAAWYQREIDKISENSSKLSEVEIILIDSLATDRLALATMEFDRPYEHPYYWAAFTVTGI